MWRRIVSYRNFNHFSNNLNKETLKSNLVNEDLLEIIADYYDFVECHNPRYACSC